MKPIEGFIGGAYRSSSLPASAQRTVNLFVEKGPAGDMLIGTPGLRLLFEMAAGPSRGADVMNGRVFRVGGNTLYETTTGTPVALGTLSTSSGAVSMTNNDTQLLIVDGVAGYIYDGTTFSVITDPDFPNGVTKAAYLGTFFIVGVDGSKSFSISGLNDGDSWDGLDFASVQDRPEVLASLVVLHDRLFLATATGMEEWVNTGNAEFAFERDTGTSIEVGIEARDSLVSMNNGLYWLGRDKDGGGIIFSLQGGVPARISTHAIESEIQSYSVRSDAFGMAYQQAGHSFYVLTFPTAEKTWVYDAATQELAERSYCAPNTLLEQRWRGRDHVLNNGVHEVGDWENGNVYALDPTVFTDNGQTIRRTRTSPPIAPFSRMTFNRFAVDAEMGTATANMLMRFSNTGGKTWSEAREKSLGALGEVGKRAVFYRCGTMREGGRRVFEVTITDPVKTALYGAWFDATADAA